MIKLISLGFLFVLNINFVFASNNTTANSNCPGNTSLYCHLNPTDLSRGEHNIVYSCMSQNQINNSSNVHYVVTDGLCPLIPPSVNIYVGGFEDGLYVCAVDILGHQCELDDTNENADSLVVDGVNVGKHYEWDAPVLSEFGNTDLGKTTQLHLNSFRFGTIYKVKYCYDYERVISGTDLILNQMGQLRGNFTATVANSSVAGNYVNLADVSAELTYECEDYLGPVYADNGTFYPFNENTTNELEIMADFDLSTNSIGKCWFEATFSEGNIGNIRPINRSAADGVTTGKIQTSVDLEMQLIQL